MKNKKLIVGIASLLKIEESVITSALENESGDDSLIQDFKKENNVFTLADISKIKGNAINEGKAIALVDLEKTNANEFPAAIYHRVKGFAFEKVEKDAAKKYNVDQYDNLEDLMSKIASKGKGGDDEKDIQIKTLKQTILEKEGEITTKVKEVETKYTSDFINRDFANALSGIKLDGEEEAAKNQSKLFAGAFKGQFGFDYKDGKTIVLDAEKKILVDKLGDPMPVSDVYKNFVITHGGKLKEEAVGGRGDGSSQQTTNLNLKGKTLNEVLAAKGVKPNTDEADKVFVEWNAANK